MKRLLSQLIIIGMAVFIWPGSHNTSASQENATLNNRVAWVAADNSSPSGDSEAGSFILYENGGGVGCRQATIEEARVLSRRDQSDQLRRVSTDDYSVQQKGLQIVLRATQQLQNLPQARAAFLKAAAIWTEKIQTPLTIVIDVDYGPTNFGVKWGPQIVGSTNPQQLTSDDYRSVRAQLIAGASDEQTRAIYNALPLDSVPTDSGNISTMKAPSANARALGLLDAVADPDGREKNLGRPPSIAFNSAVGFDFDPSDGIDANKIDFEGVAVHEIGHALGFVSSAGDPHEGDNKVPLSLSVWDLFRLRQGTEGDAFGTAQRITNPGGEQMFSAAGIAVPLSTGVSSRGGDGWSTWHWKADELLNRYIGIMEPTIDNGQRHVMTAYDLLALRLMGYNLKPGIEIAPEIGEFSGRILDDGVILTGLAVNIGNATIDARVEVLDESGAVLGEYPLASFNPGEVSIAEFAVQFTGINQWRGATQASLTLLDGLGHHGATLTTGILKGDSGGPKLVSLSFDGSVLRLKAKNLSVGLSLEVNGVSVTIPNIKLKGSKKVQAEATAAELQLSAGPNRVRIICDGLRSNAMILSL